MIFAHVMFQGTETLQGVMCFPRFFKPFFFKKKVPGELVYDTCACDVPGH